MSEIVLDNKINKKKILNNELKNRRMKLDELRKKGYVFPNNFRPNFDLYQLHKNYNKKSNEELKKLKIDISVAGRMVNRRIMGQVSFITIQNIEKKIQLYIKKSNLSTEDEYKKFKKFDLGDILGANGKLFKTRTGELSIRCNKIVLLTKSLRPLPEKFHGLLDSENCYRKRYLDLISNEKSRKTFKIRSYIIAELRNFLISQGYIEVETPMMQTVPGGAIAKPFVTHHNTLKKDIYLRISPELYLKQLIVGGFEKIFEINKNFRNEGISPSHNPEFTMMEIYIAYANYKDLILLVEKLFSNLTQKILGTKIVKYGNYIFDFNKPFIKMTMLESICYFHKEINLDSLKNISSITILAKSLGIDIKKNWGLGKIQNKIFEEIVEDKLIYPTFIFSYPTEVSPLARRNDKNPFFTDRFEFFIGGREIGNGFSELNDVDDQTLRFISQSKIKNLDDEMKMIYDEDYLVALEYGLPPTAGLGIGIDRLILILTNNNNIRDVILFPMLRSKRIN